MLAKGAIVGIATLGSAKFFQFLIKLIISRLGVNELGIYYVVITTYTSIVTIATLGIPLGVARYVSYYLGKKDKNKIRFIVNAGLTIILIFGAITGASMIVGAHALAKQTGLINAAMFFRWLGIVITGSMTILVIRQALFGLLKFPLAYALENIESLIRLLAIYLGVVVMQHGIPGALAGYIFAVGCTVIIGYLLLQRVLQPYRYSFAFSRELTSYTWPVSLSEIITALTSALIVIMLNVSKGVIEVGYYAAAVSIASLLFLIPQIILPIHFPLITLRFSKNQSIRKQFVLVVFFLAIILIPSYIIMIAAGPLITRWLFGSGYLTSSTILQWIAPAYTIYALFVWPTRQLLDMAGFTKTNLALTAMRSCIIVSVVIMAIPSLGSMALSYALLSGWGIEAIVCLLLVKQKALV